MSEERETVLVVDDEEPVRRTFREWLSGADLGCDVVSAPDAEEALRIAAAQPIDLAILDWALGAGDDGLQLLQDLTAFQPNVVAIMVTGFANQATPLDAMRVGVRDYLDKNHDLNRDTFLAAVRKQLAKIRPEKRARRLHQSLASFRSTVEKVLPLVQASAAITDPVPLGSAIPALVRFLATAVQAGSATLLVRHFDTNADGQHTETLHAYDATGARLETSLAPWSRSLAGSAASMGQPAAINDLSKPQLGFELQPFEQGKRCVLATPMDVGGGVHAVVELFDPPDGAFRPEHAELARAGAHVGAELLRQSLGQRQTHRLLVDAVAAALHEADRVRSTLAGQTVAEPNDLTPENVVAKLQAGLTQTVGDRQVAESTLRLAEAIRSLGQSHGVTALRHCITLVESLKSLLDTEAS